MDQNSSTSSDNRSAAVSTSQMKMLLDVSRMLAITTDLNALLQRIAEATSSLLLCERASIWLHDPTTNQLWTKVALDSGEIRVAPDAGIVGAAFSSNIVLHVPNPYDDPRFNRDNDRRSGFVTRSLLAAPMLDAGNRPVGVIQAVNKISESFTAEDISLLHLLADQAGVAVQRNRLQLEAQKAAEMRKEMDLTAKVQEAMLPAGAPNFHGFDIAGWAKPASVTGGDCYDFWKMPDGRLGIFLGDASGHGLAPTLVISQARTLARALCDSTQSCHPHAILKRINARLSEDLEPTRFVTAFLGFLAPDGTLEWQSAGHGPLLLRPSAAASVSSIEAPVPPLNAIADLPDDVPPPMQLAPDGSLVLMTDGIFESFSPSGQLFGSQRVVELLDRCQGSSANQCIVQMHAAVAQWQHNDEPGDDQTIVVIRSIA